MVNSASAVKDEDYLNVQQLCISFASRLQRKSQVGVIQFGRTVDVVSTLSDDRDGVIAKIEGMESLRMNHLLISLFEGMEKILGATNLHAALKSCTNEFGSSR